MANIGTLAISVVAKTEKFEKGMKKANGSWTSFVKGFVSIAAIAGAVRGITSVASELSRRIDEAAQRVDRLAKAGRAIGVTYQEMRRLEIIAKMSGIEVNALSTGMRSLSVQLLNAKRGLATSVDLFRRLNIEVSSLEGMSMPEIMEKVAREIQRVPDPAERLALAAQLLGRQGGAIAAAADGLADAAAAAERISDSLTEQDVRRIEAANDAVTELGETVNSVWNKMAADSSGLRLAVTQVTNEHLQMAKNDPWEKLLAGILKYNNAISQTIGLLNAANSVGVKMSENQKKEADALDERIRQRLENSDKFMMDMAMGVFDQVGTTKWAEASASDYAKSFEENLSKKLADLPPQVNMRKLWEESFVGGMRANVSTAIQEEMSAIEQVLGDFEQRAQRIRESARPRMSAGVQAKTSGFDIRGLLIGGGLNNQEQKQLDELEDQSKYLQMIYRRLGNQVAMVGA